MGIQNRKTLLAATGQVTVKFTIHIIRIEAMLFKIYMEMCHLEMMLMSGAIINFCISIILRGHMVPGSLIYIKRKPSTLL